MGKQIKTQIGKLGRIVTGKTPPTKVLEYFGDRYPFITPSDISDYSIKYLATTERYLSEKGKEYQKSLLIPENTVCFVAIGSTVGKMCYTKTKSFTNQQIHSIIVDENKHNPHYLFYKIHYEYPKIKSIADANGAGKPIINKTDFSNIEIEVSDLSTQQKIASILSAYDDLIENNTRRIKILEEMAQTIYKEWFVNFRFPGYEKVKFVDSPLGKIPVGWEVKKVDNEFDYVSRGVTPKYKDGSGKYVINQKSNRGSTIAEEELKELDPTLSVPVDKYAVFGDLLINSLGEGTIGRVHFYTGESNKYAVDQHMSICRSQKKSISLYLYMYLASDEGQYRIYSLKTGGTNMTMFNISVLREFEFVEPKMALLEKFYEFSLPLYSLKQSLLNKNRSLRTTRDLLLPKLMSGEVEV